jgi:hypothetical protein
LPMNSTERALSDEHESISWPTDLKADNACEHLWQRFFQLSWIKHARRAVFVFAHSYAVGYFCRRRLNRCRMTLDASKEPLTHQVAH